MKEKFSMKRRIAAMLCGAALALTVGVASAHHSFGAEFDANQPINLEGTVVKVELINPHSWIHLDVKNPDGTTARWMIEAGTANTLLRKGLNQNSLPIGTVVRVDGYRAKDGANRANGRDITLPDGNKVFVGSSSTPGGAAGGR
jgi:hypothetical protein